MSAAVITDYSSIKNIVFDLGAVIINIDFARTFKAFAQLSNLSETDISDRYLKSTFFIDFEKGYIGNYTFIKHVRELLELPLSVSDDAVIDGWNKLLLTIPAERIKRIQALSESYRVFLLSNTNPIHIKEVQHILFRDAGVHRLEQLFEKTWYSYDLGLIKPHTSIYETVLAEKQLLASETIFLDDNADNIEGAVKTGIQAILVEGENDLINILKHA